MIYFNGEFMEEELCRISPFERGFLFADGVYEVIRNNGKKFIEFDAHINRLKNGLESLQINFNETDKLLEICNELIEKNNLNNSESIVYIQISRGISYPRNHLFPVSNTPVTILVSISKFTPDKNFHDTGVKIILLEDTRWSRCNLKTTMLLPNVLARQKAFEQNAEEAVLVRNGLITEGTHTSFCGIKNEYLVIPPLSNFILPGITRKVVNKICDALEIPFLERNINEDELKSFDELMLLSTKMDITPVIKVGDSLINGGFPGEDTIRIQKAYLEYIYD